MRSFIVLRLIRPMLTSSLLLIWVLVFTNCNRKEGLKIASSNPPQSTFPAPGAESDLDFLPPSKETAPEQNKISPSHPVPPPVSSPPLPGGGLAPLSCAISQDASVAIIPVGPDFRPLPPSTPVTLKVEANANLKLVSTEGSHPAHFIDMPGNLLLPTPHRMFSAQFFIPGSANKAVLRMSNGVEGCVVEATVKVQDQLTRFLNKLFKKLLGREAHPYELADLVATTWARGTLVPAVSAILQGDERRRLAIGSLYRIFLRREATHGDAESWLKIWKSAGAEAVEMGIIGSAEYYSKSGGNNNGFLAALYSDLLGRAPDQAGFDFHRTALLMSTRRDVVQNFLTSAERKAREVQAIYFSFLERNPLEQEASLALERLNGGWSYEDIIEKLISEVAKQHFNLPKDDIHSPPFKSYNQAIAKAVKLIYLQDFITLLYFHILVRAPDVPGYKAWIEKYHAGRSKREIAKDFILSLEGQKRWGVFLKDYNITKAKTYAGFLSNHFHLSWQGSGITIDRIEATLESGAPLLDVFSDLLASDEFMNAHACYPYPGTLCVFHHQSNSP